MTKRKSPGLPAGFRENKLVEVHYMVQELLPQVYAFVASQAADFEGLQIKPKDGGVLVIAKKVDEDGRPVVMFCGGYDTLSALVDLERALAAAKWREEKPWSPNGSSGKDSR